MDRERWVSAFRDALQELRPHTPLKFAMTLAYNEYADGRDPIAAAREWHERQSSAPAAATKKRKR
jgi:hypothetical protein